ncbi:MAG: hypothetical protein WCO78_05045 [Candidatus Roizmanbacteria bacterium]
MSDIHPILSPPPKRRVSPIKVLLFVVLVISSVAVGYASRRTNSTDPNNQLLTSELNSRLTPAQSKLQVLSEETRTLQSYLPDRVRDVASRAADLQQIPVNPEMIVNMGREVAASAAGTMSFEAEKLASEAAQSMTDFIYKNTIEKVIHYLILALPESRQKDYPQ